MGSKPLPAAQTEGAAERLVIDATSCWMGGLWADALGEQDNPPLGGTGVADARSAGIERRCDAVLVDVYGNVDAIRYRQLRAVEAQVVSDLASRVRSIANNDRVDRPHGEELSKLVHAVADAHRENVRARRVADDVKREEEGPGSSRSERATDKTHAAQVLLQTTGIEALLSVDAGALSHEARAIGLLCSLDRLEVARRLPEHLKVYAVGAPFAAVFGVQPPTVPDDPTTPIKTGTWPRYLSQIASSAGHASPPEAIEPIDRESLAWAGVLQAFADRLRVEQGSVSPRTQLPFVLGRVADRLEEENHTMRALFQAEQRERK
jgi:hypothetical protein